MHYFDSRDMPLRLRHILASGALPPAFPAVRIDGEPYWDGGILSNTPVEAVFDDKPRRNSLVFAVQMWHPRGAEPNRSGRCSAGRRTSSSPAATESHIARQQQLHRLRHIIAELAARPPGGASGRATASRYWRPMAASRRMHVVRLLAPRLDPRIRPRTSTSAAGIRRGAPADAPTRWRPRVAALERRIRSDGRLHPARGGSRRDDHRGPSKGLNSGPRAESCLTMTQSQQNGAAVPAQGAAATAAADEFHGRFASSGDLR